jgi:phosphomevalonate kinase
MIVRAPGKLVITGAYAVLEGAPAIVCAVDRYAYASTESPEIDTRELYKGHAKLGLGSSAASLVARLGAAAAQRGDDLRAPRVREAIFREARAEHAHAQSGGSGVDVAAATWGGVLRYAIGAEGHEHRPLAVPPDLAFEAFWSGTPASTAGLRARVDALRERDARRWEARFTELKAVAIVAAGELEAGRVQGFLEAVRRTLRALAALGEDAEAPIVPAAFRELAQIAEAHGAAFLPSGAGGGDAGVYVGTCPPPPEVMRRAFDLDLRPLGMKVDAAGLSAVTVART